VDDSAHGDEPSESKDAGPGKAKPDILLREPVAGAIPTVVPHPPRLPSQVPPWLEETVPAGTPGDVPTAADDVPAELRDAPAPPPEIPATPAAPEPSFSLLAEAADDDGHPDAGVVDRAGEVPAAPAVLESLAPLADADDVGSWEAPATEPEPEGIAGPDEHAAPAQEAALAVEDAPPAHVEAPSAVPSGDEEFMEAAQPLVAGPGADIEHEAVPPVVSGVDVSPPPQSESVDISVEQDARESEVSAFDQRIWHDTSESQQAAPAFAADTATQIIDAPQSAGQAVPIREEQIWSGPQAVEPSLRWPEPEHTDPQRDPPSEADARSEPVPSNDQNATQAVFVAPPVTPAQEASLAPSSVAAVWPSTSFPAPASGRADQSVSYLRRAARIAGGVVLTLTVAVLLLVVLYRWVDPPASTLMLGQQLTGTQIEQRWVPIERISPHLVQAVILSEDGGFCRHRGVDWPALEEAIESSRGGSTITMQVVKNLFLWPQRSYIRKALEIVLAYVVEAVWPKERVLEIYLNIAEWGPGIFGAEAAARSHFGRSASQLTPQEAAMLAVSLPSPIERRAGYPDQQMRRLANNLMLRMRAVRAVPQCVRVRRAGG
jgi:monofunctional biosynthetic peptidoglycan transglycosylase